MTTDSAFVTSIVTSSIIFLILYGFFRFFYRSSSNAAIYFPSRIQRGELLPSPSFLGVFDWLRDVFVVNEDELVTRAGLDAAIYIRFLFTCLQILLWSMLYCVPVIISVSVTDNYYATYNAAQTDPMKQLDFTTFDRISMGNITPESSRLWACLIGTYWVGLGAIYFLWTNYNCVVTLRAHNYTAMGGALLSKQYATLVRDIPAGAVEGKDGDAMQDLFGRIYGPSYMGGQSVYDSNKASKIYAELVKTEKKLAHAEAVFEQSQTDALPKGKRPMHKTGFLGLLGTKVDTLDWCPIEIRKLRAKLDEEQVKAMAVPRASAIAFFDSKQLAAMAAQAMHVEQSHSWQVSPAPEPADVEWGNLAIPFYQRFVRTAIVYTLVTLLIIFYLIPITFVSSLSTLANLNKILPFISSITNIGPLSDVLQAFLPQIALIVFLALFPMLLSFLSSLEGLPSKSRIQRAASGKYFYFMVFNVFLGVTLGGTLLNAGAQLLKNPSSIVNLLAAAVPQQATFFITFIALKFLVSKALELSRLLPLLIFSLKKKYVCKTEKEVEEAAAPGAFDYLSLVPNDLLTMTLGLCYAVLAPFILPFACAYFAFSWAIMKNQALNVYVPEWESRGRFWPHMHARIVAALMLSQLTMLGYMGIKKFAATVILIPLLIITMAYYFFAYSRFYRSFEHTSLNMSSSDVVEAAPPMGELQTYYTPDCLKSEEQRAALGNKNKGVESEEPLVGKGVDDV